MNSTEKPIEVSITGKLVEGSVMARRLAGVLSALTLPKAENDLSPGDFLGVPRLFVKEIAFQEHDDKFTIQATLSDYTSVQEGGNACPYKTITFK